MAQIIGMGSSENYSVSTAELSFQGHLTEEHEGAGGGENDWLHFVGFFVRVSFAQTMLTVSPANKMVALI